MKKLIAVLIIALLVTGCTPSVHKNSETSSPDIVPSEAASTEPSAPGPTPSESAMGEIYSYPLIEFNLDNAIIPSNTNPIDGMNEKSSWKELYSAELKRHIDSLSTKFNICDLDGDGIPELLISDGDYHAAGGRIFTVNDGKLSDLGGYGSWGEFQYDPINKYIFSGMTGQGETYCSVFRLDNGKMVEIVSFHDNRGAVDESKWQFEVNNQSVTRETFYIEQAKYNFSNNELPFVRKYSITESEILQVVGK